MTDDEALSRFGLVPDDTVLAEVRCELLAEVERQRAGNGNIELLRVLCIQLFASAHPEDALLVWRAKQSNFDTACGIDVQLLCGAGVSDTKEFLSHCDESDAKRALQYIIECEGSGDFADFSPERHLSFYRHYYDLSDQPDEAV